jgi:hypothetical protein
MILASFFTTILCLASLIASGKLAEVMLTILIGTGFRFCASDRFSFPTISFFGEFIKLPFSLVPFLVNFPSLLRWCLFSSHASNV